MGFVNRLTASLVLQAKGKKITVPAGNIKRFGVHLHPWGFEATAVFWLVSQASESEDTLFDWFVADDLIEASMSLDRTFDTVGEKAEPLKVRGFVEERSVLERAFPELASGPVLHRRYAIRFRDPAAFAWSRHRPSTLLANASHGELIQAQTPASIRLGRKWKKASKKHAMLALGLGQDPGGASFLDFVTWLGRRDGFALFFDPDQDSYTLDDTKPRQKPLSFPGDDVETVEIHFDPAPRHAITVLDGSAEAKTKEKKVANPRGLQGVTQELLLVPPIAQDVDDRVKAVRPSLDVPKPRLEIRFSRFPSITLRSMGLYDFSDDFSQRLFPARKKYRLLHLHIEAEAERQAATDDSDDDTNSFVLDLSADFEESADPRLAHREIVEPTWPFVVEGKLVSDVGAKDEGTFQAYTDPKVKVEHHQVFVPLWSKKIPVPFHPNLTPGHFYFPPYKDARVLLALSFEEAEIARFLDWRPGARLPKESQGNHILFGKKAKDETSVRHTYVDSKPTLTVERTSSRDHQTIVVSEGTILLRTEETKDQKK